MGYSSRVRTARKSTLGLLSSCSSGLWSQLGTVWHGWRRLRVSLEQLHREKGDQKGGYVYLLPKPLHLALHLQQSDTLGIYTSYCSGLEAPSLQGPTGDLGCGVLLLRLFNNQNKNFCPSLAPLVPS